MKAAVKAALERQHARRRAIYDEWRSLQPCKNGSVSVAADGSCLRCGADQGVHGYACDFDRKNEGDGTHPNQVGPWSCAELFDEGVSGDWAFRSATAQAPHVDVLDAPVLEDGIERGLGGH